MTSNEIKKTLKSAEKTDKETKEVLDSVDFLISDKLTNNDVVIDDNVVEEMVNKFSTEEKWINKIKNNNDLQIGDILLTFDHNSWKSKLIWYFCDIPDIPKISHALLYIDNLQVIDILPEGVVLGTLLDYSESNYDLYVMRCTEEFDKKKIKEYCLSKAGELKYSYIQLFILLAKRIFKTKYTIFQSFILSTKRILKIKHDKEKKERGTICSKFLANVFKHVNIDLVPEKNPEETTPFDIFKSNKTNLINVLKRN